MQANRNAMMKTNTLPTMAASRTIEIPRTILSGERKDEGSKESLLEGLSVSQIAAGALAAVTSMLLASQIGIAGSVIGVAVGSIVATVTSQLYKRFLSASAEKLRRLHVSDGADDAAAAGLSAVPVASESERTVCEWTFTPRIGDERTKVSDAVLQACDYSHAIAPSIA